MKRTGNANELLIVFLVLVAFILASGLGLENEMLRAENERLRETSSIVIDLKEGWCD